MRIHSATVSHRSVGGQATILGQPRRSALKLAEPIERRKWSSMRLASSLPWAMKCAQSRHCSRASKVYHGRRGGLEQPESSMGKSTTGTRDVAEVSSVQYRAGMFDALHSVQGEIRESRQTVRSRYASWAVFRRTRILVSECEMTVNEVADRLHPGRPWCARNISRTAEQFRLLALALPQHIGTSAGGRSGWDLPASKTRGRQTRVAYDSRRVIRSVLWARRDRLAPIAKESRYSVMGARDPLRWLSGAYQVPIRASMHIEHQHHRRRLALETIRSRPEIFTASPLVRPATGCGEASVSKCTCQRFPPTGHTARQGRRARSCGGYVLLLISSSLPTYRTRMLLPHRSVSPSLRP